MKRRLQQLCLSIAVAACLVRLPSAAFTRDLFTSYDDVKDALASLADDLPPALKSSDATLQRLAWSGWVPVHDREIRERLARGDDDTIVNWLLFGTSFTREPKVLFEVSVSARDLPTLISRRITDFITTLRSTRPDERVLFARKLFLDEGYGVENARDRERLKNHLLSEAERILLERQRYAQREDSFRPGDFADQMMVQSHLFQDRGLSLDTSILPGFALEQALRTMKSRGLIAPNTIRRVAIIGPGLDFADKSSGYDFYPVQTLQPFSTIDSLLRLDLSGVGQVEVTTFDISPRVNDHILHLRSPYVLMLPIDLRTAWEPDLVEYWKHFGERIGSEAQPRKSPVQGLEVRAVQVTSQIRAAVHPEDFNVVTESWAGAPFDLVIATNVFVYYDKLDQSLAFAGVEAMLRPGGFFLTNNAIVELPSSKLRSLGFATVRHSPEISDHVFWYRRNG